MDSLVAAAGATAALMLANRGMRRFGMSFEMKAWMGLAWLLIIVTVMLVASALRA